MNSEQANGSDREERGRDPERSYLIADPLYAGEYEGGVSLVGIGTAVLRWRRSILAITAGAALLVAAVLLLLPRTYTSEASFVPQTDQGQMSQLAGLASQLGVQVPVGQAGKSPQFYADLLVSRDLLRNVVSTRYRTGDKAGPATTDSADLVELFTVDGQTRDERLANAVEELHERMSTQTEVETGIVQISVTTRSPSLSRQVAQRLVNLVHQFNIETRQFQARAEREFLAGRIDSVRHELLAAEDSLRRFLEQNRQYQNSPQLRFEYERLQRRVSVQQQVYLSLAQSFEGAKIEEVRNTPVITVVDQPSRPALPDPQGLLLKSVGAGFLALLFGVAWAAGSELLREVQAEEPDEYAQFERALEEARAEVRGIWLRIRRSLRGSGT